MLSTNSSDYAAARARAVAGFVEFRQILFCAYSFRLRRVRVRVRLVICEIGLTEFDNNIDGRCSDPEHRTSGVTAYHRYVHGTHTL